MAKPVGPYSPFVVANGFVYTSGQIGIDETGALAGNDVAAQAEQALSNLEKVLADAGCALSDVVKTTVFVTNMGDYAAVNEIYAAKFGETRPARSAIGVAALPLGAVIEIEAVARLNA